MSTSETRDASPRPYHHGNLRPTLLDIAEQVLRDDGIESVTLRELARKAGVSHAAPSRHFADRNALLIALAAAGYQRLGELVIAAVDHAGTDFNAQFRALASTFVRFAIDNSALLDVMFTIGKNREAEELRTATAPLYAAFGALVDRGLALGALRGGDADRVRPLIIATMQGVAAFAAADRIAATRVDAMVEDACLLFTM
ncbi:TetR/AcrR family transcriptional regulator [Gryllotalpicola reticulitermitis]|uniref:TetR/AcrR family transcriptional regulator n=1 Tax=Gryllotalpicola reticulitermitis TaxID=1184153 RepID=A0ABV8Q616_9MICO